MSQVYSGTSIKDLHKGKGPWNYYTPPITASKHHSVLYELPYCTSTTPKPHIQGKPKHWDEDHVRMPFSKHNVFPVKDDAKSTSLKPRWEIICNAFSKPIKSLSDFETALNSYNSSLPSFSALEYFFERIFNEDETNVFFNILLPKIIELALRLPEILPGSLPLLKKNHNKSVSLSQLQVSSLLANAFLCTFPWRKEVAAVYPGVNFVRLFSANVRHDRINCVAEKLKCIIAYFRKITESDPIGVLTFERIFIPRNKVPRWDTMENNVGNTRVHIQSSGTIEDDGLGFLQVDFANKNVGGGVLGYGCVQEEIRFVICPELLISRLFVEQLGDTEAVIVRGAERFSKYRGYGETFLWDGNYKDQIPFDKYGRKLTTIAIIDATMFFKAEHQYYPNAILRELNKAYVGFSSHYTENLAPVATGNWGCGAFGGDTQLKTLIQLIACSASHRDLVYFTFGDTELQESFYNMYLFLATNRVSIGELWRMFCKFAVSKLPPDQFYSFIQQSLFDQTNKTEVPKTESQPETNKIPVEKVMNSIQSTPVSNINIVSSSSPSKKESSKKDEVVKPELVYESSSSSEDIISSSQPDFEYLIPVKKVKEKKAFNEKLFEDNHRDILDIFSEIDGPPIPNKNKVDDIDTLLVEDLRRNEDPVTPGSSGDKDDVMLVDEDIEEPTVSVKSKSKITDYFSKWNKS